MDSSNSQLPGTPIGKATRALRSKGLACSTPNTSSYSQFSFNLTTDSAVLEETDELSSSGGFSDSKMVTVVESDSETTINLSLICNEEISATHTHKDLNEIHTVNKEFVELDEDNYLLSDKVRLGNISETPENELKRESQNSDMSKELLKNCFVEQIEISKRQENQNLPSDSGAVGSVINKVKLEDYEIVECSVADSEFIDLEIPDIGVLEETSDSNYGSDLLHDEDSVGIPKNLNAENMQPQSNRFEMLKVNSNEKLIEVYNPEVLQCGETLVKCDVKINEDISEADILSEPTFGEIKKNLDSVNPTEVSTDFNKTLADPLYNYNVAVDFNKSNDIMNNTLVNEGSESVVMNDMILDSSKEIMYEVKIDTESAKNICGKNTSTLDMKDVDHVSNIFLEIPIADGFNDCQNSLDINSNKIKILSDKHNEKLDESLCNHAIKRCFNDSSKNISSLKNSLEDINRQIKDVGKTSSLLIESNYKTTHEINNNEIRCENDAMCIDSSEKSPLLVDSCSLKVSNEVKEITHSKKRPFELTDETNLVDKAKRGKVLDTNNELETICGSCTTSPGNTSEKEINKIELDCGFKDLSYSSKNSEEEILQIAASESDLNIFEVEKSQLKDSNIKKSECNVFEENQPKTSGSTNPTEEFANNSACKGRIVKKVIKIGKDCMYYLSRENCKNCSILTNDTFNTVDEASCTTFDIPSDIGNDFAMNKPDNLTRDKCEISRNNLIENNILVHLPVEPSGSMTSASFVKKDPVQKNETRNMSTLSKFSCFSKPKMALATIDEVCDSKDAVVDASTSKINSNHIHTDKKTSDNLLSENNKFIASTAQEFKRYQECEIEKLNQIAMEEIDKTITDEDMYYSRKDEMSICFDTRNEHLMALDEGPKITSKPEENSLATTSKRLDIAAIREKHVEEIKPPPAKRICLEVPQVPQRPTDRPLEVFVSNNACENADNNDPKWQVYKKMTNDELRYECVRKKWLNPQIPNVNSNLSTYNWRARNGLQPLQFTKNNLKSYYSTMGGSVHDIFTKARDNAKTLFEQKVRALEVKKDQRFNEADEKLHFSLCRTDPKWRYLYYNDYRQEMDAIQNECSSQFESLVMGLEERIASIDKAEEEVTTVSNFYKGLDAKGDISRTHLTPWQLCCWYDREDTLNNYEVFYSENN